MEICGFISNLFVILWWEDLLSDFGASVIIIDALRFAKGVQKPIGFRHHDVGSSRFTSNVFARLESQ